MPIAATVAAVAATLSHFFICSIAAILPAPLTTLQVRQCLPHYDFQFRQRTLDLTASELAMWPTLADSVTIMEMTIQELGNAGSFGVSLNVNESIGVEGR